MKKMVLILVAVLLPWPIHAMKPLSDTELSAVSGRSGVSIFVDVTMDIHADVIAWGDSDGIGSGPYNPWYVAAGGYVGVQNLTMKGFSISPRTSYNSVSFWPDSDSISFFNGQPYYHVDAGQKRP